MSNARRHPSSLAKHHTAGAKNRRKKTKMCSAESLEAFMKRGAWSNIPWKLACSLAPAFVSLPLALPPPHTQYQHDSNMATCDVSFDEMAVALSYISLGGGAAAPASSARGLPSLAPVKKAKKETKKAVAADDDVSSDTRKKSHRGIVVQEVRQMYGWCCLLARQIPRHRCTVDFVFTLHRKPPPPCCTRRRFRPAFTCL